MTAAGTIIPATDTITPRAPAISRPSSHASATGRIPGLSWQSAHASLNSPSEIQCIRSTRMRRITNRVLCPPPTDWAPMSNHARASARARRRMSHAGGSASIHCRAYVATSSQPGSAMTQWLWPTNSWNSVLAGEERYRR